MCFISLSLCCGELLIVVNFMVAINIRLAEITDKNIIPFGTLNVNEVCLGNYLPDNQKNFYKTLCDSIENMSFEIGIRF